MAVVTVEIKKEAVSSVEKPHETPPGWEPNVLAFACHYCAFASLRENCFLLRLGNFALQPE